MMTNINLKIPIYYSQLCIFESFLKDPHNNWSKEHVDQGFSWRKNSVSFATLIAEGEHNVNVTLNELINRDEISRYCVRAFLVPFEISSNTIEVGSVYDTYSLSVIPGKYKLQVEFFEIDQSYNVKINLSLGSCRHSILRNDGLLIESENFFLEADSAT